MDTPEKSKNNHTATPSLMKPSSSSYHTSEGNLEGVGSIDQINWDDIMNFYTSTEHAMQDTLPCVGMFSDSARRESGYRENEEINPSSSKEKRRRLEQLGEGDDFCKKCKCKKSKCLMLYCGCFAAGVHCMGPCACINCFNKPIHKDIVLAARKQIESGNSCAFAPKVIRWSDSLSAPRWHKRGCSCKKSSCQMKYCRCCEGGVGCSVYCRCEGCKNSFGKKENASVVLSVDHQLEEGETHGNNNNTINSNNSLTTQTMVFEDFPTESGFCIPDHGLNRNCSSNMKMKEHLIASPSLVAGESSMPKTTTVFINDIFFEIPTGVFNVRDTFGDDAVLLNSSGEPVLTDESGLTHQPLQDGEFYHMLRAQDYLTSVGSNINTWM